MTQSYWLDPRDNSKLLAAVLSLLAGDAHVAVEGDADELLALQLDRLPGALFGPTAPFGREFGPDSTMIVLPLSNENEAALLHHALAPNRQISPAVGALQIERSGRVEFLAGDNFHRECVSVGPAIPALFLQELTQQGVIHGFYARAEALARFGAV